MTAQCTQPELLRTQARLFDEKAAKADAEVLFLEDGSAEIHPATKKRADGHRDEARGCRDLAKALRAGADALEKEQSA